MESELELLKRKMLLQMMTGEKRPETRCPFEKQGNLAKLKKLLPKCRLVIIDFWAEWCAPCRLVEPVIDKIAQRHGDKVSVIKINVDENPDAAMAFEVMSIPTIVVFYKGKPLRAFLGYSPHLYRNLEEIIQRYS